MEFASRMLRKPSLVIVILASTLTKLAMAEGPSETSVAMSATLIGMISFIMLLTYFMNWKDPDIQAKAYDTISNTISIFCAVLLFSSFNDLAETYIIDPIFGDGESHGALFVDMLHMLFWFLMMQVSLAHFSGAAGPWREEPDIFETLSGNDQDDVLEQKELNLKCFSVLLAHITGFASINAFATAQIVFFSKSPAMSFLAVPLAFVSMVILQRFTDAVREKVSEGDDNETDEFEKMWDEEAEEAENDVMGLVISFTGMSAIRYAISGCLPNPEGKEEACGEDALFQHTFGEKAMLIGVGFVWAVALFIVRVGWPAWAEKEAIEEMPHSTKEEVQRQKRVARRARNMEGLYVAISMSFSWSMFYGGQMMLAGFRSLFHGEDELMSVCLAMIISLIMMFGLLPLDKLADADWTGEKADSAIRALMSAMSLLIGFAWEQCFDTSVDALAEKSNQFTADAPFINQHSVKLVLSIFCAMILVPAWKLYILPFIVHEGWKTGTVLKIDDLCQAAQAIIERDLEEIEGESEEDEKRLEREKAKLMRAAKFFQMMQAALPYSEDAKMAVDAAETVQYTALPGDNEHHLQRKNETLMAELQKTQAEGLRSQRAFDATMESMLMSMKQMHETVGRLEQAQKTMP